MATRYAPRLRDTGFPEDAALILLFHAALRLVGRGELEAVKDEDSLLKGKSKGYGGGASSSPSTSKSPSETCFVMAAGRKLARRA